jgi:DNA-binding GntR family transcriptional regulator
MNIVVDRSSPVPLWYQVARELERLIHDNELSKGGFLENEIELAERWQVSRPTLRRAIQELVDNGMLVRQRGVGTQVVNRQPPARVRLTSLFDELAEAGRNPSTTVIIREHIIADDDVTRALSLKPGTAVLHIVRCRNVGDRRMAILRNWIRADAADVLTLASLRNEGLYSLLRNNGVRPHFAVQTIGARVALPIDASLLGLPVGAPLLTMKRVVQDFKGVPIDIEENIYDATQHSLEMAVLET